LIRWRKPDSNRRRLSGSSEVVPTFRQPFSQYIEPAATHFWALANGVFSKGPKTGPKKGWLYANHVGSPRTMKRRFSISFPVGYLRFLRHLGRRWTSPEVYGVGTAGHRIRTLSACLCGENIFSFNSRAQNRTRKDMDFSEHLWTHPDRRLAIIEE